MSDEKHSPGPWGLDNGGAYAISRRDGKAYGVALAYGETLEEKFANAALIARAPELLAENERLHDKLTTLDAELAGWQTKSDGLEAELRASREQTAAVERERDIYKTEAHDNAAVSGHNIKLREAAERSLEEARAELESATIRGRELLDEAAAELLVVQRERDEALGTFKILREDWRADVAALKTAERERDEALGWRETANTWERLCNEQAQRGDDAEREVTKLREALGRIERWFGEFPPTGRTWEDGTPMSYGAAFGSNGERDFMRDIAATALSSPTTPAGEASHQQCGWRRGSDEFRCLRETGHTGDCLFTIPTSKRRK